MSGTEVGAEAFTALVRTAQYIAGSSLQQDLCEVIAGVMARFHGAVWTAFAGYDHRGLLECRYASESVAFFREEGVPEPLRRAAEGVLESGFLDIREGPADVAVLLPLQEEGQVRLVLLVGYPPEQWPSRERLNLLLAVAGLVEIALERRRADEALRRYQEYLESLVERRTAELRQKNERLTGEIAERERAEAVLRESEERFRTLNESLSVGVVMIDPAFRIVHANPVLRRWFSSEACSGYPFCYATLHNPPLDCPSEGCPVSRTLADGGHHRGERTVVVDGRTRTFHLLSSPITDGEGKVTAAIEVLEDITERKEAERALAARNEQIRRASVKEARQAGKIEIASGVLHDIGNAVAGMGATLVEYRNAEHWPEIDGLKRLQGLLDARADAVDAALGTGKGRALCDYVAELITRLDERARHQRAATDRIQSIVTHISDILTLQRQYTRGGAAERRSEIDLCAVMDDAVNIMASSIQKRGITVARRYEAGGRRLSGDGTVLLQIFVNLLKNAGEAFDQGGASVDRRIDIGITLDRAGGSFVVDVCDNACGFDPDVAEGLFEQGRTTKEKGSGIGLAEVRGMVAAHRGSVTLSSPGVGRGACVQILLPAERNEPEGESHG